MESNQNRQGDVAASGLVAGMVLYKTKSNKENKVEISNRSGTESVELKQSSQLDVEWSGLVLRRET